MTGADQIVFSEIEISLTKFYLRDVKTLWRNVNFGEMYQKFVLVGNRHHLS